MADNKSVEAPDFDLLRKETGPATEIALRTLWLVLNNEIDQRRQNARRNQARIVGKILVSTATTNQDNFDTMDSTITLFTGASAFNLTGLRNGVEGRIVFLMNVGAGTITVKYASASSDVLNRIRTQALADVSLTTDKTIALGYTNSLWRELKWA